MRYYKENLKEQLVAIAWEIGKAGTWQKVNMRKVAQKAVVSTIAFLQPYHQIAFCRKFHCGERQYPLRMTRKEHQN